MSWESVKLEQIFEIARGGSPRPIDDFITEEPDGLNWISIKDASNSGKYISKTKLKIRKEGLSKSRLVHPGDFLLTNSMSFGRPYIMNTTGCIHDGWLVLSGDKNKVNQDYFYYLLGSDLLHKKFSSLAAGAVVKNLNINLVKNVEVPLPPLTEQQKIAAILDAADSLRQKDQQLVERYTALSQSLFLEMFGDPVTNPMGWEKKPLSEFIDNLDTGVSVNSTDEDFTFNKYGVLKTSCVYSGIFKPYEAKVVRDDELDRMKLNPKADSIIISRMNTPELVGKSAYINQDYSMLFLPDRLWQTQKSELQHSVRWLAVAIAFESFMREISKISSGTSGSMKNISKGNFLSLPLIYPPSQKQNQFAERIQLIEAQKQQAQRSLEKSEALFNSLLQRAFTGELTAKMAA